MTGRGPAPPRELSVAIGWAMIVVIVYASLTPSPPQTPGLPHADKLLHLLAYFAPMAWFGQLYVSRRLWVAMGLVGLGVLLEVVQGIGGVRDSSLWDGVANVIGVACGWGVLRTPVGEVLGWLRE